MKVLKPWRRGVHRVIRGAAVAARSPNLSTFTIPQAVLPMSVIIFGWPVFSRWLLVHAWFSDVFFISMKNRNFIMNHVGFIIDLFCFYLRNWVKILLLEVLGRENMDLIEQYLKMTSWVELSMFRCSIFSPNRSRDAWFYWKQTWRELLAVFGAWAEWSVNSFMN